MAKRAGQIIPRGKRTWLVRVYLGRDPQTGKRKYHNKTIHGTSKDAQKYLNAMLRDRDMGAFVEPTRMTLNEYLDKWLETAAKPRLREKTLRDYEGLLRRHVRPTLGTRPLAEIGPLEIQRVYNAIQERGLSARTVRFTHAVLRSALQQAVKWRLLAQNPADRVDLPRQEKREMSVLTPQQARIFLEACKENRYGTLFALAITTGLRPSEYLALKWTDLDWDSGSIRVARTLEAMQGGGWRFAETKRARSRRTVKLQSFVLQLLRDHIVAQAEEREQAGEKWRDHGLIFTAQNGEPVNERNLVQQYFKPLLKLAGLPDIRLYDLRHTAATLALSAGVPPKVVSEQLGHASAAFTLDVYSHVLPHMQEAAAAKVEALLNSHGALQGSLGWKN